MSKVRISTVFTIAAVFLTTLCIVDSGFFAKAAANTCGTVAECAQAAATSAKAASDAAIKAAASFLPAGTIVAWYATQGPVPTGWAICDGTNGTPDLRGKFLSGVGKFEDVSGTAFGTASHNHTFSGTTFDPRHGPNGDHTDGHGGANNSHNPPETDGLDHRHDFTGTTSDASNLPPNMHVLFIMKTQ